MKQANQKQDIKNIVLSEKKETIENLIKNYNEILYNGGIVNSTQVTNLRQEIAEYNAAAKYRCIEALSLLIKTSDDLEGFYNEYIAHPYFQGLSMSIIDEEFSLNNKEFYLHLADVDKGINKYIVSDGQYLHMTKVVLHNIIQNAFDGDNSYKGVATYTIKPLTKELREVSKKYDMEKYSIKGLKEQIQTIINAIIPLSMKIFISNGDVRKIMHGVVKSNVGGKITIANSDTLLRFIFEAMKRVLSKGTYDVIVPDSINKVKKEEEKEIHKKEIETEETATQEKVLKELNDENPVKE